MESIAQKYRLETDAADWPTFCDTEAREWLIERVRNLLELFGQPMPLWLLTDRVFHMTAGGHPHGMPECLQRLCMWDAMHGCVERALRHVAVPLWGLK